MVLAGYIRNAGPYRCTPLLPPAIRSGAANGGPWGEKVGLSLVIRSPLSWTRDCTPGVHTRDTRSGR